ncbi:hypothetical protein F5Y06DRAFT_297922 [Hypoxylon sp. FL0890]|nr:hypothetical protein F5Y06DRAFT_297922 [Hypoxylon sp. FL0890]
MSNYPNSPLAPPPYGHDSNITRLDKINMFMNSCEFLDSLRIDANRLGAVITASDQSIGNQQDRPWNAVDGSSNPRDKECRPQWQLLSWFIQETDANYQKLQPSPGQNMPPDIATWLTKYHRSRDVRKAGLHTLADILQSHTPINFNEILCAVIVLHAILDFNSKRNSLEGDVESALSGWSYMNSLTEANREAIGVVLKRLALSPACLRDPPGANVLETGSMFADDTLRPLSIVISDSSLSDIPVYEPLGYNTGAPPLNSHLNSAFISQNGYPMPHSFNQPQPAGTYPPWGSEHSAFSNSPIMEMGYSFQNDLGQYPQQHGSGQLFGSAHSSGYTHDERATDVIGMNRPTPLISFMGFLDGFIALGDLHRLFSHGIDSSNRINLPATYNARASETEFLISAERSLFGPLKNVQSLQDPIIQAIISTTQSLALLGGLSTFTRMAGYMIHLGMNILKTRTSCCSFSRTVLQHCPKASVTDVIGQFTRSWGLTENQPPEQFIDEIGRHHSGAYHPAHLVQSPDARPRNLRSLHTREPTIPSRASSSRHTPSIVDLSTSNMPSRLDNTEMSVVSELTTNTTLSTTSTAKCAGCDKCKKSFKGKNFRSHLSRHKRSHRDADEIPCPSGCPKVFKGSRTDNIRAHCRKVHNEELPRDYWSVRPKSSEP